MLFYDILKIILNIRYRYNPSSNSNLSFHVGADILNSLLLIQMAARTDVLVSIVIFLTILRVRNHFYFNNSGIGNVFTKDTLNKCFLYTRKRDKMKPIHSFLICLLLIICGDIEQCSAPESYSADLRNICSFKGLKIAHLNTQGISTSFNGICELLGHKSEIDILTLSETHLQQEDTDELFKII